MGGWGGGVGSGRIPAQRVVVWLPTHHRARHRRAVVRPLVTRQTGDVAHRIGTHAHVIERAGGIRGGGGRDRDDRQCAQSGRGEDAELEARERHHPGQRPRGLHRDCVGHRIPCYGLEQDPVDGPRRAATGIAVHRCGGAVIRHRKPSLGVRDEHDKGKICGAMC